MIPTLFGVTVLTFAIVKNAPGSVENMVVAQQGGGGNAGAKGDVNAQIEAFRKQWLLDQSLPKQFFHYLGPFNLGEHGHPWFGGDGEDKWNGLLVGDLGTKLLEPSKHVNEELIERLKVTVPLALFSVFLSYLLALPLGIFAAIRQGTPLEVGSTALLFVLYALPVFWGGMLLQLIFGAVGFDLLPVLGLHDVQAEGMTSSERFWDTVKHGVLPVVTLAYGGLAYLSRQMRVGVVDSITQDYVRTARAKGLSEKAVIGKHVLRNSMIPIITVFASILPILIGGSIVVESVFDIPGMGLYAFEGLQNREYNVIMACTLAVALMTMLGILLSDILYAFVDPRIRYD